MIQAMFSGIAGMSAFKADLDIIGNNIANVNTTAYKSGRATFKEMLSQTVNSGSGPTATAGGTNPSQIGSGVLLGAVQSDMTQGSMTATGRPTDCAIEGNGYFIVGDGSGINYTRDGAFTYDAAFNLVSSSTGMKVLGWAADTVTGAVDTSSQISGSSSIKVPINGMSIAQQTSAVTMSGNLNAAAKTYDVATYSELEGSITKASKYSSQFDMYDSLGITHKVKIEYTKAADTATTPPLASWNYSVTCADAGASVVAGGQLTFDSEGVSKVGEVPLTFALTDSKGAKNPVEMTFDFTKVTQIAADTSSVNMSSQDGKPMGTLENFTLDKSGKVMGIFSNGTTRILGQLAVATFNNPSGLSKVGNNMVSESSNSGIAKIGVPGDGSNGNISSGYLEASNVDLAKEFANMIIAQRGFQANSKIITTSDEILQELVNLKR